MKVPESLLDAALETLATIHDDPKALDRLRAIASEAMRLGPEDSDAALINGWLLVREGLQRPSKSMEEREACYVAAATEFKRAIDLGLSGYSRAPGLALVALYKTWHNFQAGDEQGPPVCRSLLAMVCQGKPTRHYQKAVFLSLYGPDDQPSLILAELDAALSLERHPSSLTFRARLRHRLGNPEGAHQDEAEARLLKPG